MHSKLFFIFLLLIIFFNVPLVFAQDKIIDVKDTSLIDTVSEDKIDKNENQLPYVAIGITVGGVVLGSYFTAKGLKISQRKTEADLFLRLNERLYNSEDAKLIIDAMIQDPPAPILKINNGKLENRILENFLNEVQAVCILVNTKVLSQDFAEPGFVWVLTHVKKNPEIMSYIEFAQKKNYGYYSWGEISEYKPKKYQRKIEYNAKINFQDKFELKNDADSNSSEWKILYNKYLDNYRKADEINSSLGNEETKKVFG